MTVFSEDQNGLKKTKNLDGAKDHLNIVTPVQAPEIQ